MLSNVRFIFLLSVAAILVMSLVNALPTPDKEENHLKDSAIVKNKGKHHKQIGHKNESLLVKRQGILFDQNENDSSVDGESTTKKEQRDKGDDKNKTKVKTNSEIKHEEKHEEKHHSKDKRGSKSEEETTTTSSETTSKKTSKKSSSKKDDSEKKFLGIL